MLVEPTSAQFFIICAVFFFFPVVLVESPTVTKIGLPTGRLFLCLPITAQLFLGEFYNTPAVYLPQAQKRCYAIPMESGEQNQEAIANATDGNHPPPLLSAAAAKKQKAAEEKARRDAHLLQVIENTAWQEAENFTGQCAEADRWL